MAKLSIDELVSKIKMLPPMDVVVQKLLILVQDQEVSASEVSRALSSDPALASKVLALVNSAMYGFSNKISTINQAVAIIGNKSISNLVLSLSAIDIFKNYDGPIAMKSFWHHSISTAAASQIIATRVQYPIPEDAFVAGLLHDLGQLVLSMFAPDAYKKAVDQGYSVLVDSEAELLGVNHAVVGALLLEHWKIPHHIVEVVEQHHFDEKHNGGGNELLNIVRAAEIVASVKSNIPVDCYSSANADKVLAQLDIPADEYHMIIGKVSRACVQTAALFNIKLDVCTAADGDMPHSIVVFGNDSFRTKWVCSLLKNMGYYAVPALIDQYSYIERVNPCYAILDLKGLAPGHIGAVEAVLSEKGVPFSVIPDAQGKSSKVKSAASNTAELPLVFSYQKLSEQIASN